MDPITKACSLLCNDIPHAMNSVYEPYECFCSEGYYWNHKLLSCYKKCGEIPNAMRSLTSTE